MPTKKSATKKVVKAKFAPGTKGANNITVATKKAPAKKAAKSSVVKAKFAPATKGANN